MFTLRTLGFAALALSLLFALRPALAGSDPVEPPTPTVLEATPEEVEKLMAALEKAAADRDDQLLAAALSDMDTHVDDSFKPFIKKAMGSKDKKVQALAIRAAASHRMEDEQKQVLKLLKASSKGKSKKGQSDVSGVVAAAAVDYLARLAIEGMEKEVLDQLDRLYQGENRIGASYAEELVRAAVHYLGQTKEMSAVPRLVEMLREPIPENPNDPNNPPATYWEARTVIWHASEGWVRWALTEITGEQYRTYREWNAFVGQNEKKFK